MSTLRRQAGWIVALGCASAIAAGCSGGGSVPSLTPTGAKSPGQSSSAKKVAVTIAFGAPAASKAPSWDAAGKRKPQYISPSTLGAVITATSTDNSANNATYGYDISADDSACVSNPLGGSLDCTLTISLAVDTYSISLATYDANDSGLPANLGTELSVDIENESVVDSSTANVFTFNPQAFVAGFSFYGENDEARVRSTARLGTARARRNAGVRNPEVLPSALPGYVYGASGGADESIDADGLALDRDGNAIDEYPGNTTFVNGTFTVSVAEPADTTGCSAADPCMGVSNALGTSYGPSGGPPTPPATIALATPSDEELTFAYSGGGSYGAGVVAWPTPQPSSSAAAPTGKRPYYADISIPDPTGGSITPYVVPHEYVAPLFAYASVGANTPFVPPAGFETIYVWAAQALLPSKSAGYTAQFGNNSECEDSNGDVVATVEGATYYAGYGEVFAIETSPASGTETTDCRLTLSDGAIDSQTVSIPVQDVQIQARRRNPGIGNAKVVK